MFEKTETTESFNKQVFRSIKNLSDFENFSKHFMCSGHNSHKAFLKVINKNLPLKLESNFAFYWSKIGT